MPSGPRADEQRFVDEQRAFWREVDAGHFAWATASAFFAQTEAALLDGVSVRAGGSLLEVGAGEGGNLFHLAARLPGLRLVGVDFTAGKARFAAERLGIATAAADATALPFGDHTFDAVLMRDLLHHLPRGHRHAALAEARRVLVPGGRLFVAEPNGWNPLIAAAALLQSAERGMLETRASRLHAEITAAGFAAISIEPRQPMPISRLVLHPRFGLPRLGSLAPVRALLTHVEKASERLPGAIWAYLFCTAEKPATPDGSRP